MPVRNGAAYLGQAIESILAQSFTDFRLIVSDNASEDGTEEICRRFVRRDSRVSYVRAPKNRGASWNFRHVVEHADATYFKWAAHDDLIAPTYLARCVAALDADPTAALAHTTSLIINEGGVVRAIYRDPHDVSVDSAYHRFARTVWNPGRCHRLFGLIRLDVLRACRPFGGYIHADTVVLAELALRGRFLHLDEPLFLSRDHAHSATRTLVTYTDVSGFFAPLGPARRQFMRWLRPMHFLRGVARAPITPVEKLRCAVLLIAWCGARAVNLGLSRLHRRSGPPTHSPHTGLAQSAPTDARVGAGATGPMGRPTTTRQ